MTYFSDNPTTCPRRLPTFARLVLNGSLSREEAVAALAAARPAGADASGWRARSTWALGERVGALAAARRRAVWAVRDALAPLLAAGAGRAALEAAVARADRDAVLLPSERRALLQAEVARALRWSKG
jgi:hypothetical protein